MNLTETVLFREMQKRATSIPAPPAGLLREFDDLRSILIEHGKYVVELFPEYTPHDHTSHLDHLFALADRILGKPLYDSLKPTELVLLAFALYSHDWGMAVSRREREVLESGASNDLPQLPNEPREAQEYIEEQLENGYGSEAAWQDYLRRTHGLRSGARLRQQLVPLGSTFAEAVARLAEGHTLDSSQIRDTNRYPTSYSACGETVNLAALANYIRIVDLLDIGDDRTPYALWKFVAPVDSISRMEWKKHRALSPAAVEVGTSPREIVIQGHTDDHAVYAALADLRSWVDTQFQASIMNLRSMSDRYALDLDSRIKWRLETTGFEPVLMRFEVDRREVLRLLGRELYGNDRLAFVRELLQNSVDAIDARQALLAAHDQTLDGEIRVEIVDAASGLQLTWSDNGIGMDLDIMKSYFSQIGRSWYRSRAARSIGKIRPISQFGLGILSCFAVANSLTVRTRMDPVSGGGRDGLVVEIPSRDNHFRVSKDGRLPTGTSIQMTIQREFAKDVTASSIITSLGQIARFVSCDVVIEANGRFERLLAYPSAREFEIADIEGPAPAVVGMRGSAAEDLASVTRRVSFAIGGPSKEYFGYYSALMPSRPTQAINSTDRSQWQLEGVTIDLDDVIVEDEQALFVKGIRAGAVRPTMAGPHGEGSSIGRVYSSWINPTVLINLTDPHSVEFDLGRNKCRLVNQSIIDDLWSELPPN